MANRSAERSSANSLHVVSATEANRSFSAILRRARHGESTAITDRGRIVARLVPETAGEDAGARRQRLESAWEKTEARLRGQPALNLGKFNRDWAYDD
jgi:prevent-host-death family protein